MRWQAVRILRLGAILAVPVIMGVFVVATIMGPLRPVRQATSYGLLSPALAVIDIAAGATLIGAGVIAWLFRQRLVGSLAMLAGACWFGSDWAGGLAVDPVVRIVGMVASMLVLPLLVGLVVGSQGALRRRSGVLLLVLLVGVTALLAIGWMRWYAPQLDPRCLELCGMDPISADADFRRARLITIALLTLQAVAGSSLTAWSFMRLVRASRTGRRVGGPILVPAVAVGLTWTVWAVGSLLPSTVTPATEATMVAAFVGRALSAIALAAGLAWLVLRAWRTLQAVRGIAWRLSPLPGGGSLRVALATAVGDPGLELRFPLPGTGALVDHDGRAAADVEPGHALRIEHAGRLVALAVTPRDDGHDVARDLGEAVRLAAANEGLLAVVRHDLQELRASRARVVRTGDEERHRLERDLHDGAQQRMLTVLAELVRARESARAEGDATAAQALDRAVARADAAIEALRGIARGIHPALLTEAGLVAALDQLAIEAPIPVDLDAPAEVDCGPATAAIAWRVAADAIGQAAAADADEVRLHVAGGGGALRITVVVTGAATALDLEPLGDRAAAGGGSLVAPAATDDARTFIVELPCA